MGSDTLEELRKFLKSVPFHYGWEFKDIIFRHGLVNIFLKNLQIEKYF